MAPTKNGTTVRHADQAKKWALLAIKLGLAGTLIGAIIGYGFFCFWRHTKLPYLFGFYGCDPAHGPGLNLEECRPLDPYDGLNYWAARTRVEEMWPDFVAWTAAVLGGVPALYGFIRAAWSLFLVMIGQIASAVRKD